MAPGQVGAVFASNGEVVGLEAFSSARPYAAVAHEILVELDKGAWAVMASARKLGSLLT